MRVKFIPHFVEGTTKQRGWWVSLEYKGRINQSWFYGPSKTNFNMQHLHDRGFGLLKTEKQLARFNKLYNEKLESIKKHELKPIIVYECPHCKKLFKNFDRHDCKKNPKLKNCFSCKWRYGWKEPEEIDCIDVGIGCIPVIEILPDCKNPDNEKRSYGQEAELDQLKQNDYDLQCKGYEEGDYFDDVLKFEPEGEQGPF